MSDEAPTENPKVELANKDWVMKELMDTERRFEKAFHEQTQFLGQKNEDLKKEFADTINTQTRWMVGLMMTMTIAIIAAVLFKG
jgi:hypothetical protein